MTLVENESIKNEKQGPEHNQKECKIVSQFLLKRAESEKKFWGSFDLSHYFYFGVLNLNMGFSNKISLLNIKNKNAKKVKKKI